MMAHSRVCSRHFPNTDSTKTPDLTLGKRFASKKSWTARAQRACKRNLDQELAELSSRDRRSTPVSAAVTVSREPSHDDSEDISVPMVVNIGSTLIAMLVYTYNFAILLYWKATVTFELLINRYRSSARDNELLR